MLPLKMTVNLFSYLKFRGVTMRHSLITTAMFAVISSVASLEIQAATLNYGDVLTITTGQVLYDTYGNSIGI